MYSFLSGLGDYACGSGVLLGLCVLVVYIFCWLCAKLPDVFFRRICAGGNDSAVSSQSPLAKLKEPFVFSGEASKFREWAFSVELGLRNQKFRNLSQEVDYAASFLDGNARLWLITSLEAGKLFSSWKDFKTALAEVYGPHHEQERARLQFFSLKQSGDLESFVAAFSRLSLLIPDMDEHSRAVAFLQGLAEPLRTEALKEHPKTLSEAIKAARNFREGRHFSSTVQPCVQLCELDTLYGSRGARLRKLTPEDRARLRRENRCFACRQVGHMARDCVDRSHPNAVRQ